MEVMATARKKNEDQKDIINFQKITCSTEITDVADLDTALLENCIQKLAASNPVFRTVISVDDRGTLHRCTTNDFSLCIIKAVPEVTETENSNISDTEEGAPSRHCITATLLPIENSTWSLRFSASRLLCDESFLEHCLDITIEMYNSGNSVSFHSTVADQKDGEMNQEQDDVDYWSKVLQCADVSLDLVGERRNSPLDCNNVDTFSFTFENDIREKLESCCKLQNVHLSVVFLSLFQTLVYRYCHQERFCIISCVRETSLKAREDKPFRETCIDCNITEETTFVKLLKDSEGKISEALSHTDYVLSRALSKKCLSSLKHLPRFYYRRSLITSSIHSGRIEKSKSCVIKRSPLLSGLILKITEIDAQYMCTVEYNTDYVKKSTVLRMVGHLQNLLEGALSSNESQLITLPILTSKESEDLRYWNNTDMPSNMQHLRVEKVFEMVANQKQANVALICGNDTITYECLNQRSKSFGEYLSLQNSASGVIGVCMKKSIELVITLLGILKAGHAYLLIDPAQPQERVLHILNEAAPIMIIVDIVSKDLIPEKFNVLQYTDKFTAMSKIKVQHAAGLKSSPQSVAYLLYTSGTSGTPKGVVIDHSSILALVNAWKAILSQTDMQGVLVSASVSFTLFPGQLFLALLTGNKGIIVSNLLHVPTIHSKNEITLISTPPAGLLPILTEKDMPTTVRCIILGGDHITHEVVATIQNLPHVPIIKVISTHGCSENVLFDSFYVAESLGEEVCVGKPFPNNKLYIVDKLLQLVPIGITGELCVSGSQLAAGYFKNPELTAARFLPNPFESVNKTKYSRFYRTGDLARRRDDGNIEIVGRMDFQVKINGIRVELEEISVCLMQHPLIRKAVVVLHKNQQSSVGTAGLQVLVAYYSSENCLPLTEKDLKMFLATRLPPYMVPTYYVHMEELPLNRNGKIDRASLPPLSRASQSCNSNTVVVLPRTDMEHQVYRLTCDLLKTKCVGVTENLFQHGTDSILAVRFVVKILQQFKVELQVKDIFQYPTIVGLSTLVENALKGNVVQDDFTPDVDSKLPDDIVASSIGFPDVGNPQNVFLTGATGFIGAFLLVELLNNTEATVYCLVRSGNKSIGVMRIQSNLIKYGIWEPKFKPRLMVCPGDIAKHKLGLPDDDYDWLSTNIDVVYHSAAPVNFVLSYAAIRQETVEGTNEMLRMACYKKLKAFHFVSSIAVHGANYVCGTELRYENDELDNTKAQLPDMGYARMKWVSEKLVRSAVQRGLPVTILRPSFVVGHSKTGAVSTSEYISRLIKGCIQLRSYPDLKAPLWLVPVDYVVKAIIHITTKSENLGQTFHLTPDPSNDVSCTDIMSWIHEFGYTLQKKCYVEWYEDLKKNTSEHHDNALYPLLQFVKQQLDVQYLMGEKKVFIGFDSRNTHQALKGSGITCQSVDRNVVNKMNTYLTKEGFLSPALSDNRQPTPRKKLKLL